MYLILTHSQDVLQPDALHTSVVRLVLIYSRELGVSFPSLNHPLILFKYIKELALPCMPVTLLFRFEDRIVLNKVQWMFTRS